VLCSGSHAEFTPGCIVQPSVLSTHAWLAAICMASHFPLASGWRRVGEGKAGSRGTWLWSDSLPRTSLVSPLSWSFCGWVQNEGMLELALDSWWGFSRDSCWFPPHPRHPRDPDLSSRGGGNLEETPRPWGRPGLSWKMRQNYILENILQETQLWLHIPAFLAYVNS
jgi:hypothetical protein